MNEDDVVGLILFGGLIVVFVAILGISAIADSVQSILIEIGIPPSVAGDMGSIIFASIFLFILLAVVRIVFS